MGAVFGTISTASEIPLYSLGSVMKIEFFFHFSTINQNQLVRKQYHLTAFKFLITITVAVFNTCIYFLYLDSIDIAAVEVFPFVSYDV